MSKIIKAINNFKYFGFKNSLGMLYEKLIVDPKRFKSDTERSLPQFDGDYKKAKMPSSEYERTEHNILYLVHRFFPYKAGGTERFTYNLAKGEIERGNKVIILTLEPDATMEQKYEEYDEMLYRYYEYDGIPVVSLKYKKAPLGLFYKSIDTDNLAMHSFARFITEKLEIDLVHATYPQPFASFLSECKKIGLPYVVTCTDFCMMCHYSSMVDTTGAFCTGTCEQTKCARVCKTYGCQDFKERFAAAKEVLLGAEFVTVPSEFVAKVMSKEFPDVAFLPVPHGISSAFEYKMRTDRVKKFIYAGTLSPLKGVHLLIEAFTRLERSDLTLEIYGSGNSSYTKTLREMANDNVIFRGTIDASQMSEVYSEADCIVIPSMWYETYNFVLREALATGALVIAADIGAMPEAIKEGTNGFLHTPASVDSIEEALRRALEFDFLNYEESELPSVEEERAIYSDIYASSTRIQ